MRSGPGGINAPGDRSRHWLRQLMERPCSTGVGRIRLVRITLIIIILISRLMSSLILRTLDARSLGAVNGYVESDHSSQRQPEHVA